MVEQLSDSLLLLRWAARGDAVRHRGPCVIPQAGITCGVTPGACACVIGIGGIGRNCDRLRMEPDYLCHCARHAAGVSATAGAACCGRGVVVVGVVLVPCCRQQGAGRQRGFGRKRLQAGGYGTAGGGEKGAPFGLRSVVFWHCPALKVRQERQFGLDLPLKNVQERWWQGCKASVGRIHFYWGEFVVGTKQDEPGRLQLPHIPKEDVSSFPSHRSVQLPVLFRKYRSGRVADRSKSARSRLRLRQTNWGGKCRACIARSKYCDSKGRPQAAQARQ